MSGGQNYLLLHILCGCHENSESDKEPVELKLETNLCENHTAKRRYEQEGRVLLISSIYLDPYTYLKETSAANNCSWQACWQDQKVHCHVSQLQHSGKFLVGVFQLTSSSDASSFERGTLCNHKLTWFFRTFPKDLLIEMLQVILLYVKLSVGTENCLQAAQVRQLVKTTILQISNASPV